MAWAGVSMAVVLETEHPGLQHGHPFPSISPSGPGSSREAQQLPGVWFAVQKWRGSDLNLKVKSVRHQSLCSLYFAICRDLGDEPGGAWSAGWEGHLSQFGWAPPSGAAVLREPHGLGPEGAEKVDPWMLGHSS